MSSRDSLDSLIIKVLFGGAIPLDTEEQRELAYRIPKFKQAIRQWALDEVIGADEPLSVDDREWDNVQNRNKLRAEQRKRLKGDIDE